MAIIVLGHIISVCYSPVVCSTGLFPFSRYYVTVIFSRGSEITKFETRYLSLFRLDPQEESFPVRV